MKNFSNGIEIKQSFKGLFQCCDFMSFLYCFYLYLDSICYKLNHSNHLCPLGQIKFIFESLWIIASASKEMPNIYIWYLSIVMKSQTTTWQIVKLVSITPIDSCFVSFSPSRAAFPTSSNVQNLSIFFFFICLSQLM